MKLTKKQIAVLRQYEHTSDVCYMQGVKGSTELYGLKFLDWHGDQYGCHFYSITDAGRFALSQEEKK